MNDQPGIRGTRAKAKREKRDEARTLDRIELSKRKRKVRMV
jgi:hypothetical protein